MVPCKECSVTRCFVRFFENMLTNYVRSPSKMILDFAIIAAANNGEFFGRLSQKRELKKKKKKCFLDF